VLSLAYLADNWAHFQNSLAQTLAVEERRLRVFPVIIDPAVRGMIEGREMELRLRMMAMLDLTDPYVGEYNLERLAGMLGKPLKPG
jgi:hypothetical protein